MSFRSGALAVFGNVAFILLLVLIVLIPVLGGMAAIKSKSCTDQAHAMGRNHRWGIFTDCMIETDNGRFVPLANYRLTQREMGR